jgi:hypothetical protein
MKMNCSRLAVVYALVVSLALWIGTPPLHAGFVTGKNDNTDGCGAGAGGVILSK